MFITEEKRDIPVNGEYDTVVAGGGIAGVAAALAAARHGAKTLLIEKEYVLGGLATLGLIAIYLPLSDGSGKQLSFGIAEELLKLSAKHGCIKYIVNRKLVRTTYKDIPLPDMSERINVYYDPNVYSVCLERVLGEAGVTLLYGTSVCGAKTDNGKITHILIENRDGRAAIKTKAAVDATGDAVLCALCGEDTREYEKGNFMASWYFGLEDGQSQLKMLGFSNGGRPENIRGTEKKDGFTDYSAAGVTDFMLRSHYSSLCAFLEKGEVSEKYNMTALTAYPQLRMTRRVDGVYTQTAGEEGRSYPDSVGMFTDWRKNDTAYELPFSCLTGKKINNLLCAGRCISSADDMWDITRVIPVCAVSGQAAGTAAAMFDDFHNMDIALLQNALEKDGVMIHERKG